MRQPRVYVGLIVSVLALAFALRGVKWTDLRASLAGANYAWLVPAAGVVVAGQVARAARWRVLFGRGPRPDFVPAFAILCVGYLVSNVFPLRLGDPVRAWLVQTRTPAGGAEAFATVLVERAVDLLTIAAIIALWTPVPASRLLTDELGAGPWSEPANLGLVAVGMVVALYLALTVLSVAGPRAGRAAQRLVARFGLGDERAGRIAALVVGFAAGFAPLRSPGAAALTAAWSVAIWLLGALGYWLVFEAFHLEVDFAVAVLALGATALLAIVPSSPGYLGVFQVGIRVALERFGGITAGPAISSAIVLHALTMFVLVVLGFVGLRLIGLSAGELGRRVRREGDV